MEDPYLRARIIKIEPGTNDRGKAWDQYVFLGFSNGVVVHAFDLLMLIDKTMIGKTVSVTLQLFHPDVEQLAGEAYAVSPNADSLRARGSGYSFSGRIAAIDMIYKKIVLNAGIGELLLDSSPLLKRTYSPGEYIRVRPERIDVIGVRR